MHTRLHGLNEQPAYKFGRIAVAVGSIADLDEKDGQPRRVQMTSERLHYPGKAARPFLGLVDWLFCIALYLIPEDSGKMSPGLFNPGQAGSEQGRTPPPL